MPVLCFSINDKYKDKFTVYDLSAEMKQKGWFVPAYKSPHHTVPAIDIMRIVVKRNIDLVIASELLKDFQESVYKLSLFSKKMTKLNKNIDSKTPTSIKMEKKANNSRKLLNLVYHTELC